MAKNKKKKSKKNKEKNYEVGYKKPPKEHQWKKGDPSPNPKGRPKKSKNIKEAIQKVLGEEITTKDENGEVKKMACNDALARKIIKDSILNDGPTRRILLRKDFLIMETKEQEYEVDPEELKTDWGYTFASLEEMKEYEDKLQTFYKMPPDRRRLHQMLIIRALQDVMYKLEKEKEEQIREADRFLRENKRPDAPEEGNSN